MHSESFLHAAAGEVLRFWFEEIRPKQWWTVDTEFDRALAARFGATHAAAARCELESWRGTISGRLAEILVLDQFSRNLYRDDARSFACDPLALALAQEAVRIGAEQTLPAERRGFIYLPYMHSESALIHEEALRLFTTLSADHLRSEQQHKAIIDEFGRYPHRNRVLGRASTAAELEFLARGGSTF